MEGDARLPRYVAMASVARVLAAGRGGGRMGGGSRPRKGMDAAEVAAEEAATRRSGRPAALAILPDAPMSEPVHHPHR